MKDTLEKIRGDFEKARGRAIPHDEPLRAHLARCAPVLGYRILERIKDYRELYQSTPASDFKQRQELEYHLGQIEAFEKEVELFVAEGDDGIPSVAANGRVAPAQNEAVEASAEAKPGSQAATPLELDKEECRNIARLIWKGDPARAIDTVATDIVTDGHAIGRPCAWRDGKKSVSTVRKWIKDECPNPRTGRPPKGS